MPESPFVDSAALAHRFAEIAARLTGSPSAEALAVIKQDIIALYKDAAVAAEHAALFKERVKGLVSQWKSVDAGEPVPASVALMTSAVEGPESRPVVTGRVDHLGASTFVEKGWSKLSLGDAAGAEVALRRALELAPGDNDADCLLGWAQMAQRNYDAAIATFQGVLQRDPHHALSRANVGYVCLRRQQYGEAIEHLSSAIRANTDRKATLYAHLYLGMVYREREMFDDALLFFRRALELGPNLLEAWYEIGRAHWFAGQVIEARAAWRQGADANKFNPWGKRCAEMIVHVDQGGAPPLFD